jgi:hypothetical protein
MRRQREIRRLGASLYCHEDLLFSL